MDVRCEQCQTEYEFDEGRITEAGVTVKCTSCGYVFKVKRRSTAGPPLGFSDELPPELASVDKPREWKVRQTTGNIYTCRELTTLQKWIVERKVSRDDEISLSGDAWKRLGNIPELAGFFLVVDQAAKAVVYEQQLVQRPVSNPGMVPPMALTGGHMPTMPTMPSMQSMSPMRPTTQPGEPVWTSSIQARPPSLSLGDDELQAVQKHGAGKWIALGIGLAVLSFGGYLGYDRFLRAPTVVVINSTGNNGPTAPTVATAPTVVPIPTAPTAPTMAVAPTAATAPTVVPVATGATVPTAPTAPTSVTAPTAATNVVVAPTGATGATGATAPTAPTAASAPTAVTAPTAATGGTAVAVAEGKTTGKSETSKSNENGSGGKSEESSGGSSKRQPKSFEGLMAEAHKLQMREKPEPALSDYEAAIELEPNNAEAWSGKGQCLFDLDQASQAEAAFNKALQLSPGFGEALLGLAEAQKAEGKKAAAIDTYKRYLRSNPAGSEAAMAQRAIKDLSE